MPFLTVCGETRPATVDLEALVLEFVESIPDRGSEALTLPTDAEVRQFVAGVHAAREGDPRRAAELVDPLTYGLRTVVDGLTGRRFHLFEERRSNGGQWPHGWGLFVIPAGSSRPLVVEVTHPLHDINTPQVGVEAFAHGRAEALLVAGTHRYANDDGSSDVAHEDRTMVARVNAALVSRRHTVLQPHGFSDTGAGADDSRDTDESEVVVSAGTAPPPPAVEAVTAALRGKGFAVCEYDGERCADLGATRNVEGRWCREVGATFVHLELDRDVRDDRARRTLAARTVVDALVCNASYASYASR